MTKKMNGKIIVEGRYRDLRGLLKANITEKDLEQVEAWLQEPDSKHNKIVIHKR